LLGGPLTALVAAAGVAGAALVALALAASLGLALAALLAAALLGPTLLLTAQAGAFRRAPAALRLVLLLLFRLFDQGVYVLDDVALHLLRGVTRILVAQALLGLFHVPGDARDEFLRLFLLTRARLLGWVLLTGG